MKIIYFSFASLTKSLAKAYYFPHLLEKRIEVEYCDCSRVFGLPEAQHDRSFETNICRIKNFEGMRRAVEKSDPSSTLVVIGPGLEYRFRAFFKLPILFSNYPFATFDMANNPRPQNLKLKNLRKLLLNPKLLMTKIFHRIALRFLLKTNQIALPTIVFSVGCDKISKGDSVNKKFPINYVDYDIARFEINDDVEQLGYNYLLFIDQALCSHPDLEIVGTRFADVNNLEREYLHELEKIFARLEEKMMLPVVIAAHPKSSYDDDAFAGRTIIKNKTSSLIKNATMLFAHFSTASLSASIYNIPIHFLIPDMFKQLPRYPIDYIKEVEAFAKEFGAEVITCPDDVHNRNLEDINHDSYEKVLNTYARSIPTQDVHSSTFFLNYLDLIFNESRKNLKDPKSS